MRLDLRVQGDGWGPTAAGPVTECKVSGLVSSPSDILLYFIFVSFSSLSQMFNDRLEGNQLCDVRRSRPTGQPLAAAARSRGAPLP